jgi:hypothetical protein
LPVFVAAFRPVLACVAALSAVARLPAASALAGVTLVRLAALSALTGLTGLTGMRRVLILALIPIVTGRAMRLLVVATRLAMLFTFRELIHVEAPGS